MKKKKFQSKISKKESLKISLANIDSKLEKDIDYYDIPELDESFFKDADLIDYSQTKKDIHIRLDKDIIDWFKTKNRRGYQTHINDVLKFYVSSMKTYRN